MKGFDFEYYYHRTFLYELWPRLFEQETQCWSAGPPRCMFNLQEKQGHEEINWPEIGCSWSSEICEGLHHVSAGAQPGQWDPLHDSLILMDEITWKFGRPLLLTCTCSYYEELLRDFCSQSSHYAFSLTKAGGKLIINAYCFCAI